LYIHTIFRNGDKTPYEAKNSIYKEEEMEK